MAKLVRDKIPGIIKSKGQIPIVHIASNEEYWKELKIKFLEEVNEYLKDDNKEELADVLEVIDAICSFKKIDKKELERIRLDKREKRGGFNKRIVWEGNE